VAGGQLATFFNDFDVPLRRAGRPGGAPVGDLPEFRFAFDGKAMTVARAG